jgi:deoxyribodipyrimidine photo-lyase
MGFMESFMSVKALIWFAADLRICDNQVIRWLQDHPLPTLAVVFEPQDASVQRKHFFLQTVADLRRKLEERGIALLILRGEPRVEIPKLIAANEIAEVLLTEQWNARDRMTSDEVVRCCAETNLKVHFRFFDQRTLLDPDDLPFSLDELPLVFTSFRKKVESSWKVREPVGSGLEGLSGFRPTIPEGTPLIDLEASLQAPVELPFDFRGGEDAAWNRVREYFWETRSILHYKETRNGMLEKNESSKLSPWLANGSISARSLYFELKKFEAEHGANDSTRWLVFELLWRDYFKFFAHKCGERLFLPEGLASRRITWERDERVLASWRNGETGLDFVDANMKELALTGWMSNRGRQNVASHLAKGLGIDWTMGARYFESQLIDSDVESNWGNWMYVAGVGTDPRDRMFNIERQAQMYDPDRAYRNKWLKRQTRSAP